MAKARKIRNDARPEGEPINDQNLPTVGEVLMAGEVAEVLCEGDPGEGALYNNNISIEGGIENDEEDIREVAESKGQSHKAIDFEKTPESEDIDFDKPLTERESLLLEMYFTGRIDLEKAVKIAGYKTRSKAGRYYIGKRVIEKLEQDAQGRDIFRRVGLGETLVAMELLALIQNPKAGANARTAALNIASKCLGLQKEVIEGAEGAEIIIKSNPVTGKTSGETGARKAEPVARELAIVK